MSVIHLSLVPLETENDEKSHHHSVEAPTSVLQRFGEIECWNCK